MLPTGGSRHQTRNGGDGRPPLSSLRHGARDHAVFHFNGYAIRPVIGGIPSVLVNSYYAKVEIEPLGKLDSLLDPQASKRQGPLR